MVIPGIGTSSGVEDVEVDVALLSDPLITSFGLMHLPVSEVTLPAHITMLSPLSSVMKGQVAARKVEDMVEEYGITAVARLRETDDYDHVLRVRPDLLPLPGVEVRPSIRSNASSPAFAVEARNEDSAAAEAARRRLELTKASLNAPEQTLRFDFVFGPVATQFEVYRISAQPLVRSATLEGYNASFLALGHCGAGKTFTLFGEDGKPGGSRKGGNPPRPFLSLSLSLSLSLNAQARAIFKGFSFSLRY